METPGKNCVLNIEDPKSKVGTEQTMVFSGLSGLESWKMMPTICHMFCQYLFGAKACQMRAVQCALVCCCSCWGGRACHDLSHKPAGQSFACVTSTCGEPPKTDGPDDRPLHPQLGSPSSVTAQILSLSPLGPRLGDLFQPSGSENRCPWMRVILSLA